MAQVAISSWMAPLPPPNLLIGYNQAFEGCAERIVAATEAQSQHRQQLEKSALEGKLSNETRGQYMAFALALLVLVGGFALIFFNKSILGTVFIGTDIVGLVAIFIYGRSSQRSELSRKAKTTFPMEDDPK